MTHQSRPFPRLGQAVTEALTAVGVSKKRAAELSGIDRAMLNNLANGLHGPSPETLAKLARGLGLEPGIVEGWLRLKAQDKAGRVSEVAQADAPGFLPVVPSPTPDGDAASRLARLRREADVRTYVRRELEEAEERIMAGLRALFDGGKSDPTTYADAILHLDAQTGVWSVQKWPRASVASAPLCDLSHSRRLLASGRRGTSPSHDSDTTHVCYQ